MRYVLIILLLLLIPGAVCSSPRFFNKNQLFSKTWTKTTGWCFASRLKRLPPWFGLNICVPRRWASADVCLLQKIRLNENAHLMVGHKLTYSRFRYEFMKAKKEFAHGPYIHFHIRW